MHFFYDKVGISMKGSVFYALQQILKRVAAEHNTTEKEVDKEIREAIKASGLNMEPMEFIRMTTATVRAKLDEQEKRGCRKGSNLKRQPPLRFFGETFERRIR